MGRDTMGMEVGMPFEPALLSVMLVSTVIIHHPLQLDRPGKLTIQPLEQP